MVRWAGGILLHADSEAGVAFLAQQMATTPLLRLMRESSTGRTSDQNAL